MRLGRSLAIPIIVLLPSPFYSICSSAFVTRRLLFADVGQSTICPCQTRLPREARRNKLRRSLRVHVTAGPPESSSQSFTAEVAYDPHRRRERTRPDKSSATSDPVLHRIQIAASFLTFFLGISIGAAVAAILVLSPKSQRLNALGDGNGNGPDVENISTRPGGSRTAILALWARSQSYLQRSGGPDRLAPELLDERLSALLRGDGDGEPYPTTTGGRIRLAAVRGCGLLSRINYALTGGSVFEDQVAFLATLGGTGLVTPLQARTCWFDDCVEAFARRVEGRRQEKGRGGGGVWLTGGAAETAENASVQGNVVILGSGFDTRCYRLNLCQRGFRTYEVDAPGTLAEKKRVLARVGVDTSGTVYCPCEFETQDWAKELCNCTGGSFDTTLPTLIVWEGVTMYLSKDTVVETLRIVSEQAERHRSPWCVAFDYVNSDWATLPIWSEAMRRAGEPFKFAASTRDDANEIEKLVQSCGLQVMDHLKEREELSNRYIPTRYKGQPVGILGAYGAFVLASSVW